MSRDAVESQSVADGKIRSGGNALLAKPIVPIVLALVEVAMMRVLRITLILKNNNYSSLSALEEQISEKLLLVLPMITTKPVQEQMIYLQRERDDIKHARNKNISDARRLLFTEYKEARRFVQNNPTVQILVVN